VLPTVVQEAVDGAHDVPEEEAGNQKCVDLGVFLTL